MIKQLKKERDYNDYIKEMNTAMREWYDNFAVTVNKVNTGSNVYETQAIFCYTYDLRYEVYKTDRNGRNIGRAVITRFSTTGCEYDKREIGILPDSVTKAIIEFTKGLSGISSGSNSERYFEAIFRNEIGCYSELIKLSTGITKEQVNKKYTKLVSMFGPVDEIIEISKEQYNKCKRRR